MSKSFRVHLLFSPAMLPEQAYREKGKHSYILKHITEQHKKEQCIVLRGLDNQTLRSYTRKHKLVGIDLVRHRSSLLLPDASTQSIMWTSSSQWMKTKALIWICALWIPWQNSSSNIEQRKIWKCSEFHFHNLSSGTPNTLSCYTNRC